MDIYDGFSNANFRAPHNFLECLKSIVLVLVRIEDTLTQRQISQSFLNFCVFVLVCIVNSHQY